MHGACASRAGMAWPSIVGRALDREIFNFGFSGNGRMEKEVAQYLCEIDAAAFVVDCLPNMTAQLVAERAAPLAKQLREARKDAPILFVEDRTFASAWFDEKRARDHENRRKELRAAVAKLQQDGIAGVHLLPGAGLIGDDDEGTTDGSHPNDLGMMRQADKVITALQPLLAR
jgi:lysophospholipase L1-like esterase